jgi:hypothetical protein
MSVVKLIFDALKTVFPEKAVDIDKIEIPKDDPAGADTQPKNPAPAPPPGGSAQSGIPPEIAAELATLRAEREKDRQDMQKYKEIIDQSAGAMTKEKVESALQKAIAEGRLPADNKDLQEKWRAGLTKDFAAQIDLLNSLPPLPKNPAPSTGGSDDKGSSVSAVARTPVGSGVSPSILKYTAAQAAAHSK